MLSERMDQMKSKATHVLRVLLGLMTATALAALTATAQQPSPSPQKDADAKTQSSAPKDGEDAGDYNVTSSIELGYRGLSVGGDHDKYRSDLNYKAGPRLFDTSFLMQGKEGRGAALDTLLVTSSGWGADPNGYMRFTAENSSLFRLDGNFRRFKYQRYLNNFVNPAYLAPSRTADPEVGMHNYDVRQQVGDLDLTLLPKNERLSFRVGFSPTSYRGPVYTHYRQGGDEYLVLANAKSNSNEFRVGADWKLGPVDFTFLQGFRSFTDKFAINNEGLNLGANPTATSGNLTDVDISNPAESRVKYSRFTAHTFLAKKLDLSGRFIYSSATGEGGAFESLTGANFNARFAPINVTPNVLNLARYSIAGESKRPSVVADFGATFLATDKLRISNTFSLNRYHLNGGALFSAFFDVTRNGVRTQVTNPGWEWMQLKYRKIQNTVEGDYQFSDRYSMHLGYRYGETQIHETRAGYNIGTNQPIPPAGGGRIDGTAEEKSTTHAFLGGFKARPVKTWTLFMNVERGVADGVLTRIGQYDYTNFRLRSRYTPNRKVALNLNLITRDNSNPSSFEGVSLEDFGVSVKSRVFTSSVDYAPTSRLSFSGGYNYNWAETDADIIYTFAVPPASASQGNIKNGRALYFLRNHFFHFDVAAQPFNRVSFFASYRINKDVGQEGRQSDFPAGLFISSYPFSYQSPEARVSLRLNRRVDANFGYQYFNYNESDLLRYNQGNYLVTPRPQNYHAHLPYFSLRFYFGRGER